MLKNKFNKSWGKFVEAGLNQPGTLIEIVRGLDGFFKTRVKDPKIEIHLIGTIDKSGGISTEFFFDDRFTKVLSYEKIWEQGE